MQENIVTKETLKHALQGAGGGATLYKHSILISSGTFSIPGSSVTYDGESWGSITYNNAYVRREFRTIILSSSPTPLDMQDFLEELSMMNLGENGLPIWDYSGGTGVIRSLAPFSAQYFFQKISFNQTGNGTYSVSLESVTDAFQYDDQDYQITDTVEEL